MMTSNEMEMFRELFSKYCRQELDKGHCTDDYCNFCPVEHVYDEIFHRPSDEDEEEE